MQLALHIAQIIFAVLLVVAVLLQQRGAGLGAAFGGESGVFHTRRGPEKVIFIATVVLSILFFVTAAVNALYFTL